MSGATKHDNGKPMVGLVSWVFLRGLAGVLTFGAKKYAAHNWRKGFVLSRPFDALQRHLWDFWNGEDLDQESGLHHLDHAACELMFLRELWEKRKDLDDRYKPEGEKDELKIGQSQPSRSRHAGRTRKTRIHSTR